MESKGITIQQSAGSDGIFRFSLQGELTIRNATKIKEAFLGSSGSPHAIEVTVSNVSAFDMTALQLLAALKKSSKNVVINATLPDNIRGLIHRARLDNVFNSIHPVQHKP